MIRHVTIGKLAKLTGYSEDAIRKKISTGVWLEGVIWTHAPDNRVLINTEAYNQWAEGNPEFDRLQQPVSRSTSTTAARAAANDFDSRRPKRISRSPNDCMAR